MNFSDTDDDDTVEDPTENENISVSAKNNEIDQDRRHTRSMGEPTRLNTSAGTNTQLRRAMYKINDSWNTTLEDVVEFAFVGGTDDLYVNPRTFDEAWNHTDANDRKKWREAIRKEFYDMHVARKVWRPVKTNMIPKDRRLIGC